MKRARREFLRTTAGAMVGIAGGPRVDSWRLQSPIPMPTQRAKALMALFGLKYPIFEAPHGRQTCPELAIAVSNAGAMGALASLGNPDEARVAVSKVRSAIKGGPFFVNFLLAVAPMSGREPSSLRPALDAGVRIVQFSWGMPSKEAVATIRAAGAKVGMQVTSAEGARAALDLGAEYLVCQGTELADIFGAFGGTAIFGRSKP